MDNLGMKLTPAKRRGEWAEMRFMSAAAEHGLCVSKPWGDTARYDFIVQFKHYLYRIQVKSTTYKREGSYTCSAHRCRGVYVLDDFDFLAAYIVPEDLWYIIPASDALGHDSLVIRTSPNAKYARFREAWHLLKPEPTDTRDLPPRHERPNPEKASQPDCAEPQKQQTPVCLAELDCEPSR
jgi:hypothetical protein